VLDVWAQGESSIVVFYVFEPHKPISISIDGRLKLGTLGKLLMGGC
jgi:hypothetical protein